MNLNGIVIVPDSLIDRETIQNVVSEMAEAILRDFGKTSGFVMVTILKGGVFFATDLSQRLMEFGAPPIKMEFMIADSYQDALEPGGMGTEYPRSSRFNLAIRDQPVLLVDDICGTGHTLDRVSKEISERGAKFVRTATLLWHEPNCPNYTGWFVKDDQFAVGYGMDYKGHFRNDPEIRLYNKMKLKETE